MLRPGERLGRYEILEHLRAGGMASLYRARHVGPAGFAREVAIKVVHPHLALDPTFVRMFLDEARLAARVRHANVVRVEELGEDGGTYFLVMELVRGRSLAELLARLGARGERLSVELAVQIAVAIADGLHAAHETLGDDGAPLGVVHRDVSPHNVLIGRDGHVTLIDFGIARARGRQQTESGELRGKLRYMAPEQVSRGAVDRRTDVFALGVVLWQMLTGEAPFDGDSDAEIVARVVEGVRGTPNIDAALDRVVLRALAPRAEARFATARELRSALVEAVPAAAIAGPAALEAQMGALFPEDEVRSAAVVSTASAEEPTRARAAGVERGARAEPSRGAEPQPRRGRALGTAVALTIGALALGGLMWALSDEEGVAAAAGEEGVGADSTSGTGSGSDSGSGSGTGSGSGSGSGTGSGTGSGSESGSGTGSGSGLGSGTESGSGTGSGLGSGSGSGSGSESESGSGTESVSESGSDGVRRGAVAPVTEPRARRSSARGAGRAHEVIDGVPIADDTGL